MLKKPFNPSKLYDQRTFYDAFFKDVKTCKHELIIESPFITLWRIEKLLPTLERLKNKGAHIVINTRDPIEHEPEYRMQAQIAVEKMQSIGIQVLYTVKHHRKLAVIDRRVTWEGSLNILSHSDSCEIMRRIDSESEAKALLRFIELPKHIKKGSNNHGRRFQALRYLPRRKTDRSSDEVSQI